jgi:hypothetical protein
MTTARDKEQTFARLFRMMDSSFEVEASSAFRQARRMLHEDRTTFGAILDHTQHLNETNTALGEQNRDLHLENDKYRSRSNQRGFKRAALSRFGQFATWLPLTAATTFDQDEPSGDGVADPPRWFRLPRTNIPQDLRTILGIFAIVVATTVSCHMLVSNNNADGPKSTSPGQGWLARLPVNFSVDHPPWCVSCRAHQDQPAVPHAEGHASSRTGKLPSNFSIDHPPWCPACRRQQTHPDTDRQRQYGRMF